MPGKKGVAKFQHGEAVAGHETREYRVWRSMRDRCNRAAHSLFKYYGGRGISVSPRWDIYKNFLEDMGRCPAGCQIDRIDNDRGYEPTNCRWVDAKTNMRNRSSSLWLERAGERRTVSDWARTLGVRYGMITCRIGRGWSLADAVFTPS